MERRLENASSLVNIKWEETSRRFANLFNSIAGAKLLKNLSAEGLEDVKKIFFEDYDEFIAAGFLPEGNITEESVSVLEKYRDNQWSHETILEIIEDMKKLIG